MFLLAELIFLFEGFGDKFFLFPLVHPAGSVLVLKVEFGLLLQELLVEVSLGFLYKHLLELLLVLFRADPHLVVNLLLSGRSLLSVLVDQGLVSGGHARLLVESPCVLMVPIDVSLGGFVESLE